MTIPDWLEPLPAAEAMRAADAAAIASGTPGVELMERAGEGLARVAAQYIPEGLIAIVCGRGNNGGDGFVAARLLLAEGRDVRVLVTAATEDYSGDAAVNLERLEQPPQRFDAALLDGAAGAVDALLGTGATGAPRGDVAVAITALRRAGIDVVACDVPSGVDASTGEVADPDLVVHAVATATFAAGKPGLWVSPGKPCAGTVHVIDIGLPERIDAVAGLLAGDDVLVMLPSRRASSTKFSGGHVVVAGGSRGLTGAVCLAADGAARAGAGYVTACVPRSLEAVFEVKLTEVMTVGLPDEDGTLTEAGASLVLEQAERHGGAVVVGGGLGRGARQTAFAQGVVAGVRGALVIDADGLNALAGDAGRLASCQASAVVLTPHGGELGRMLRVDTGDIAARRLHWAAEAARITGCVVVLKGDDTLVASPDGPVAVSEGDAPGLATAGTGDVLAGVCGAYLAAGLDAFTAACAAVRVHVVAGRIAAEAAGPDGVIASDVVAALPSARQGISGLESADRRRRTLMLSSARVHATLPAQDLERAKRFYADRLGLTPARETPGGVFYECGGGSLFFLFPSSGEPSGGHTQIGFRVDDIESEVAALTAAGVEFEKYDSTDESGIATFGDVRSAWLKDSEGNLLGVVQLPD